MGSNFLAIRNGLEVPAFAGIEREGAEYCSMNLGFHATFSPVCLCFLTPSYCWSDSIKQIHDPHSSEVCSVVDAVIYSVSGTAVPAGNRVTYGCKPVMEHLSIVQLCIQPCSVRSVAPAVAPSVWF